MYLGRLLLEATHHRQPITANVFNNEENHRNPIQTVRTGLYFK
jgi:hypothetical protein